MTCHSIKNEILIFTKPGAIVNNNKLHIKKVNIRYQIELGIWRVAANKTIHSDCFMCLIQKCHFSIYFAHGTTQILSPQCKCVFVSLCTFTGGVEQSSLETGQRGVCQRVFNWHLDSEGRVWVHIRKGQQVSGAHKEVTMERVDG